MAGGQSQYELLCAIKADVSNYIKAMDQAGAKAGETAGKIDGHFRKINSSTQSTSSNMLSMGNSAKASLSAFAGFAGAALAMVGIAASAQEATNAMVGYNARMEQTQIAYKTMLGSAEGAKLFIDQMKDFASKTPFDFDGIDKAGKKMLAMGWAAKDIISDLTALGDAASATGTGVDGVDRMTIALGQMGMKGKISMQEINQLTEANINARKYLTDAFKFTADDFDNLEKTGVSGAEGMRAIIEGMRNDPKFKGMMDEQSKTMLGMWSTIKDNTKEIFGEIGKNAFEGTKGVIQYFSEMSDSINKTLRKEGLQGVFKNIVPPEAQELIGTYIDALSSYWGAIVNVFNRIKTTFSTLFTGDDFSKIGEALNTIIPIAGKVSEVFITVLGGAIEMVIFWFKQLFDAVVLATEIIVSAWNWVADVFTTTGKNIKSAFDAMMAGMDYIAEGFGAGAQYISDLWTDLKNWVVNSTVDLVNGVLKALGPLGTILGKTFDGVAGAVTSTGNKTYEKWINTKKESTDTQVARDALNGHKGTTGVAPGDGSKGGGGGGKHTVEDAQAKYDDILATLTEKMDSINGDKLSLNLAKVQKEYTSVIKKIEKDAKEMMQFGIDPEPLRLKAKEVLEKATEEVRYQNQKERENLQIETQRILSEATKDGIAMVENRYRKDLAEIEDLKHKAEGITNSADKEVALSNIYAKKYIAETNRTRGLDAINFESINLAKEYVEILKGMAVTEGQFNLLQKIGLQTLQEQLRLTTEVAQTEISDKMQRSNINLEKFNSQKQLLDFQLQSNALTQEEYNKSLQKLELDKNVTSEASMRLYLLQKTLEILRAQAAVDAEKSKQNRQNPGTAYGELVKDLAKQTVDYTSIMNSAIDGVTGSWMSNIMEMASGTKSWADGMKNIFGDMLKFIGAAVLEMVFKMTILKPLQNIIGAVLGSLGGIISGGTSGGNVGSYSGGFNNAQNSILNNNISAFKFGASGGPLSTGQMAIVGEQGKELWLPKTPGNIINQSQLRALGVNGSGAKAESPKISINVINNQANQVQATPSFSMDEFGETIINVVIDGLNRNVSGLGDMVARGAR